MDPSAILMEAFKQFMLKMLYDLLPDSSSGIIYYLVILGAVSFIIGLGHIAKRMFYSAFGLLVGWPLLGWLVTLPFRIAYKSIVKWVMRNDTSPGTGWLETYSVPHATGRNTILGLERQILWRHGTPARIESDNGTHFKNNLVATWAKEHGIEWIYHIPYHPQASGKIERYNGLLKTTLKALGGGTFRNWDKNLAEATWRVNTRGSINRAGPAQSDLLHTVEGDGVPVVCENNLLGRAVWVFSDANPNAPTRGVVSAQGPGHTWWVMQEDGDVHCVPQKNLTLAERP